LISDDSEIVQCRELERASNFSQSINGHHLTNDHVDISHLTKFDAFRTLGVNRDQVMDFKSWFKSHTNVFNFDTASPKTIETLSFFMISVIFLETGTHT